MPVYAVLPSPAPPLMQQRQGSLWGPGWRPVGLSPALPAFGPVQPDVYLNFAGGYAVRAGVSSPVAGQLTCVRSSTRYIDDVSGNWAPVAANLPGLSNKGLLVEEQRTNSLRNNSMQGVVTGSPGTLPTNWTQGAQPTGITRTIVGVGTVSGIDYIDIKYSGTNTGSNAQITLFLEALNNIAAASGQTWTSSFFTSIVQSDPAITAWIISVNGTNGATQTESVSSSSYTGSTLSRVSVSFLLANAGTTFVQSRVTTNAVLAGATINWTVRIGWPQLEQGAFATSPIRTTSAAVARTADLVTLISLPTFGSAYSLYAAGTPNSPTTALNQTLFSAAAVPNASSLGRSLGGGGGQSHVTMTGGINAVGVVWNQSVAGKEAGAFAVNDQVGVFNGGAPFTTNGSVGTPPAPTSVQIGSFNGTTYCNCYITEAAIWATTRLPNAQLQAGTS